MAKRKGNRNLIIILLLVIAALVVLAIVKSKQKPKGTEVEMEAVELRTIKESVSASGKVFPEKEVKISSDVSGEIVELYVEEGDSIKSGQLLAKIDPEAYLSAVDRGVATLNNAKSNEAMGRASVESNVAQKEQIMAQLNNARSIHTRNEQLAKDGVISEQAFDESLSNVQQLEANLRAAEASYRSAIKSVEAASYNVKSAAASLKELRTNLGRTTISSPTDGIISRLNVEEGERVVGTIQMSGTELMRIANFNSMEVQVEVSENDILRVAMGDTAVIEVDAYLDDEFVGTVTEIANSAANAEQAGQVILTSDQVTNFIVKIRILSESYADLIKSPGHIPFRPGMSASVDIFTEAVHEAISVPIQAVTTREKDEDESSGDEDELKEVVFVVHLDTVAMVEVKTGIQDNEYIQILEGVDDSDVIVTGPYSAVSRKLDPGDEVRKKEEKDEDEDEEADEE